MNLVQMFTKGVPPIIFVLFIGPWSDRFGRKFLFIFPLIGVILTDLSYLLNVIFYYELVAEYLMLDAIVYWFGGHMMVFLGLVSI